MSLFDEFRARTGLFAPDPDEGPTDWVAIPEDIDKVDADENLPDPIGDAESAMPPPAEAASVSE